MGLISTTSSQWTHLFQIPFMEFKPQWTNFKCTTKINNNRCHVIRSLVDVISAKERTTLKAIKVTMQNIKDLIPSRLQRQKRSGIPFMSDIFKDLFGTAPEDQVINVKNKITHLEETETILGKEIQQESKQLLSFSKTFNKRLETEQALISTNHHQIRYLDSTVAGLENNLEEQQKQSEANSEFTFMVASMVNAYSTTLFESEKWVTAVQTLLQGYLPIEFVPVDILQKVLNHLSVTLQANYPSFALAHSDPGFYYQVPATVLTKGKSSLYIGLQIPLKSSHSLMNIYRLIRFPVPLNSTSDGTSMIQSNEFFGLTTDSDFFTTFNQQTWSTCQGRSRVKVCSRALTLRSVRQLSLSERDSCILHVFRNNARQAFRTCQYVYDSNSPFDNAIQIEANRYLVGSPANHNDWVLSCNNKGPQNIKSSRFVIFDLGCRCKLQSDTWQIDGRLSNCHNKDNDFTILHAVNLASLHLVYGNYSNIDRIFGDTKLKKQPVMHIPNFNISEQKWNGLVKKGNNFQISLNKLVAQEKKSQTSYRLEADQLASNLLNDKLTPIEQPSFWIDYLVYVNVGLNVLSLFLILILFLKGKRALAFLPIPGHLPGTGGTTIKPTETSIFHIITFPQVPLPSTPETASDNDTWKFALEAVFVIFLVLGSCVMIYKCFRKCQKFALKCTSGSTETTQIMIDIRTTQQRQLIHVANCIVPLNDVVLCQFDKIDLTHSHQCLNPHVRFQYGSTELKDKMGLPIRIPALVSINYYQSYKLRAILRRNRFHATILLRCQDKERSLGYDINPTHSSTLDDSAILETSFDDTSDRALMIKPSSPSASPPGYESATTSPLQNTSISFHNIASSRK